VTVIYSYNFWFPCLFYSHFKNSTGVKGQFIPRLLFMSSIFLYMVFLIFLKWTLYGPHKSECSLSLYKTFIMYFTLLVCFTYFISFHFSFWKKHPLFSLSSYYTYTDDVVEETKESRTERMWSLHVSVPSKYFYTQQHCVVCRTLASYPRGLQFIYWFK
jgi:vacuolar-type H+-ATPase subunit I/STV1